MNHASISPPASPHYKPDLKADRATVHHYTKPIKTPRFPRNPCPSAHYTLSLLSSEHEAQRLFGSSFKLRSSVTGELLGPFALLSYTDAWIPRYCAYIHRAVLTTTLFTNRERELIVLSVASVTRAEYVVYAHRQIARSVGLSGSVVEGALGGAKFTDMLDLTKRESNVYRLASEMAGNWGRVSDATWRDVVAKDEPKAKGQEGWLEKEDVWEDIEVDGKPVEVEDGDEARLTREEVATLAQVLASTMFVSVLVNCADVEVPSEGGQAQQP
jgi:hypothetical protein